jgi:hypothetical protein
MDQNGIEFNLLMGGASASTLDMLTDVDVPAPATGDILQFDGALWINASNTLVNQSDINFSGVTTGDIIQYDGTEWINASNTLVNQSDILLTSPATNDVLSFNGSFWANASNTLIRLSDINIVTPTTDDVLSFNGTEWINASNTLARLTDVTVAPASDDVLSFDGTEWINASNTIARLSDVTLTLPATGNSLLFDGTEWINGVPVSSLDSLSDVVVPSPATDDVVSFNGTNWVNSSNTLVRLSDVTITAPATGNALVFDGTEWINSVPATTLDSLTDVNVPTPATDDVLSFNGANWENASNTLIRLSDVTITLPATSQVLTFDGAEWVNATATITLNDLSDVVAPTPATSQVLTFDGSNWIPSDPAATASSVITIGTIDTFAATGNGVTASGSTLYMQTFQGATATSTGVAGLVPAPATGDIGSYLRGDGLWDAGVLPAEVPSDNISEVIWLSTTTVPNGFIPANGGSIGRVGATYNGVDYQALYNILWSQSSTTNIVYTLSAGPGVSAAADWAANKTIVVDYRDLFIRAVGTTSAVAGLYQADQMQGHKHQHNIPYALNDPNDRNWSINNPISTGLADLSAGSNLFSNNAPDDDITYDTEVPKTDGANGTPRVGTTTRPKNVALTPFIRYAKTKAQFLAASPEFVGDTGSGGVKGLVPAPAAGDAGKFLAGNGTWSAGGSGTGSLDSVYQETFESTVPTSWSSGHDATFFNGGVLNGAISNNIATQINGARSLTYTESAIAPASNNTNDWISSPVDIPTTLKMRGNTATLSFWFTNTKTNGNMKVVVWDNTNSAILTTSADTLTNAVVAAQYNTKVFIPSTCLNVRVGLFNVTGELGKVVTIDDISLGMEQTNIANLSNDTNWVDAGVITIGATTTAPTKGTTSKDKFYWRRVGDSMEIRYEYTQTGSGTTGTGDYLVSIPSGYLVDTSKISTYSTLEGAGIWEGNVTIGNAFVGDSSDTSVGSAILYDQTKFRIMGLNPAVYTVWGGTFQLNSSTARMSAIVTVPIVGWTATTQNVITPAKNSASSATAYSPTITGYGAPTDVSFVYSREGESLVVRGTFTAGTPTAVLATITLPTGLTIDSNKITKSNLSSAAGPIVGEYAGSTQSNQNGYLVTATGTANSLIYFGLVASTTSHLVPGNGNNILSAGATVAVYFKVPITGWSMESQFLAAIPPITTCYIKDVKAAGTNGGTFTSGAWRTRDLNVINETGSTTIETCSFASLSANQFTLQTGKYKIQVNVPANQCGANQPKLYNVTSASDTLLGGSGFANTTNGQNFNTSIFGYVNVSSPSVYEIRHYAITGKSTDGFGIASNIGAEVYTQVEITKLW